MSNNVEKRQHQHQAESYGIMTAENHKSGPVDMVVSSSPALNDSQSDSAHLNNRVPVSSSSTLASSPLQSGISRGAYLSYPPYSGTGNHILTASAPYSLTFGAAHVWGTTPLYMIPHPPPVACAAKQQIGGIASTALNTSFFATNGDRPAPPPVLLLGGGGGLGASIDLHTNLILQRQQQQFLLQQQLSLHAPLGGFSGPPSHSIAAMVPTNQPNLVGQDGTTSTSIIRGTDGPGASAPNSTTIGEIKTSSLPNSGYRVQDKKDDSSFESPNAHEASPGSTDEEILERPKRPLSAYNLFFKHERRRMVEEAAQREAAVNGKKRRRDRRVRHGISFETMAKEIAQKWKQADKESLEHFETLARVEKQKYEVAMEKYKNQEKVAKENKRKRLESTLDEQTLNAYLVKEQNKQEVGGKRGKRQRNNKEEEGLP